MEKCWIDKNASSLPLHDPTDEVVQAAHGHALFAMSCVQIDHTAVYKNHVCKFCNDESKQTRCQHTLPLTGLALCA